MSPRRIVLAAGLVPLVVAGAGCSSVDGVTVESQHEALGASPTKWVAPAAYVFRLTSTCGERSFLGRFEVTVREGAVTRVRGLDRYSGDVAAHVSLDEVPTLDDLATIARNARPGSGSTTKVDPSGMPLWVRLDPVPNGWDDESCYRVGRVRALDD